MCSYLTRESCREEWSLSDGENPLGTEILLQILHHQAHPHKDLGMIHPFEAHLLPISLKTGSLDLLISCQNMLVWFLWAKFSSVTLECPTISRNCVWNKTLLRNMSKISHSYKTKGNFFKGFPIQMMTLLAERMEILWGGATVYQLTVPDHRVS